MKRFLVYSEVTAATISTSMGKPEYSYYFVLKEFLPVLRRMGEVIIVENPLQEVDALYRQSKKEHIDCIFLSFSPPHKTPLGLKCPTIPVFAWEFDTLPNEEWLNDPRNNWQYCLTLCGRAIVHSFFTKQSTHALMGADFPVECIPAPLWERMGSVRQLGNHAGKQVTLSLKSGVIIDTHSVSMERYRPAPDAVERFMEASRTRTTETAPALSNAVETPSGASTVAPQSALKITLRYAVEWYRLVLKDFAKSLVLYFQQAKRPAPKTLPSYESPVEIPPPADTTADPNDLFGFRSHTLTLDGVIFTAIFNPYDGRKNWEDMLTAFCTAFRDTPDAVLLFKLTHQEYRSAMEAMLMCMGRMPSFKCRVLLVQGFLDQADYQSLMAATAYVVNASYGEGQCLPLMEYMSCGKPAIAPRNSAMLDYIDENVGFIVKSWRDATAWPPDPRLAYRTCRHQIDWASLVDAYRNAYQCFANDQHRYQTLSRQAIECMKRHCSEKVAETRIHRLLSAAKGR